MFEKIGENAKVALGMCWTGHYGEYWGQSSPWGVPSSFMIFQQTFCSVWDRKGKFGTNFLFFVVFVKDADSISIPNPPTLSGHQYRPSTTSTSMASTTSVSMASTSSAAINTSRSTLLASCVIINIPGRFPVYRSISLTPMLPTYIDRSDWSHKLKS